MSSSDGSPDRSPGRSPSTLRLIATVLTRIVTGVTIGAAILTSGGLALAHFAGDEVLTVVSGSMTPTFRAGDAVIVGPANPSTLHAGQVIAFRDGPGGVLTTHRIVAVQHRSTGTFLQTKGDANLTPDPKWSPVGNVVGVLKGRLNRAGFWLAVYQSRQGRLCFVALPLLLIGAAQLYSMRRRKPRTVPDRLESSGVTVATMLVVGAIVVSGAMVMRPTAAVYTGATSFAPVTFKTGSFCGTPSTYDATVSADAPLIWYRFDDATGTTAHDSGSAGVDGNYLGTTDLAAAGAIRCDASTAAGFDGATTYLTNPVAYTGPDQFTIETWFRTTSYEGGRLLGFGSSQTGSSAQSDRQLFLDDAGHVVFGVAPAAKVTIASPATYNDGLWHLADATLGADGMSLYVDGVLVDAQGSTTAGDSYSGYWRVGYDDVTGWGAQTPSHFHFTGTLDEAAVYSYELTAGQVATHFVANHS